jgi:hypothetical protein
MFETILTADDEKKIRHIVQTKSKELMNRISIGDYVKANDCWRLLDCLKAIDNHFVDNALHSVHSRVQELVLGYESSYKQHVKVYKFDEADKKKALLHKIHDGLPAMQLKVNFTELSDCYVLAKHEQKLEILQELRAMMFTAGWAVGADLTGLEEILIYFYIFLQKSKTNN